MNSIADHVRQILILLGENPNRPGLQNTPRRVEKSLIEMTTGITATDQKVESLLTLFPEDHCDEMVLVKDIEFTSMCEHHLLPFHGVAHVAYLPQHKRGVVGLSKLARLVDVFAARLQVQERLTMQVTSALDEYVTSNGSACVIRAMHMCMACRGVRKSGSFTITSSLTGAFREPAVRAELLALIGNV